MPNMFKANQHIQIINIACNEGILRQGMALYLRFKEVSAWLDLSTRANDLAPSVCIWLSCEGRSGHFSVRVELTNCKWHKMVSRPATGFPAHLQVCAMQYLRYAITNAVLNVSHHQCST
jgi:hypothetical protein